MPIGWVMLRQDASISAARWLLLAFNQLHDDHLAFPCLEAFSQ